MENSTTEYKRELTDGFEKEAVAFLNTIGGEILVGVDNDGNVVGLENADKTALMITDRLKNNILPAVLGIFNVDIKTVGGKSYVVVTLASGLEKPYYLKKYGMTPNGCFMRVGSQTTQMPQNKIDDLFSRRVQHTLHNVVSPNQSLTFTQLKIFYEETGVDVTGDYFLQNLDLFTTDGKYNYAAYLLADNNGTSIKVARFNGTEKLDILERNEYGRCCLIKSAKNVLDRLKVANSTVVRVGGEAQRREIPLIDEDALREAVLNAFIHNDYINGAYPVFEIYDDRIEVVSSGGLPTGLSTDEFFAGRSLPRNKELMRIFSDLDMSEQLGTGMKKILRQYPKDIFDISEHFLSVKFMYNKEAQGIIDDPKVADKIKNDSDNDPNNDPNDSNNDPNNLDEVSKKILQILQERPEISRKELVELLNKSLKTIGRKLAALKNGGYIERIGSNKTGYWKVIK